MSPFIVGPHCRLDDGTRLVFEQLRGSLQSGGQAQREQVPADFRFQLTKEEKQEVVTNCDHLKTLKYSPVLPYAFTEHGALMAANVLNSDQANSMSVYIVRAFVRLRETILGNSKLALKLMDVEKHLDRHDESINALVNAIECLLDEPEEKTKKRRMGFIVEEE